MVVVLLAAGGYVGYRHWHAGSANPGAGASDRPPRPCPTASVASPPAPSAVSLRVRNATLRTGLAGQLRKSLRGRGFHVSSVGNTAAKVRTPVLIRYSTDRATAALTLAEQFPRSSRVAMAGHGQLEVDIGPGYSGVASPSQVAAARRHDLPAAPSPSPGCTTAP